MASGRRFQGSDRDSDVEELGDDLAVLLDQRFGAGALPVAGSGGILLILGGDPSIEGVADHGQTLLGAAGAETGRGC